MPPTKGSKEAKDFMEKVRKAKKTRNRNELKKFTDGSKLSTEGINISNDKVQILIDIIMELQKDIDYILMEHEKMKKSKK